MSGPETCRERHIELWAAWPEIREAPAPFLEHARSCADCAAELSAFEGLCGGGCLPDGRPAAWSGALGPARRAALAARTRGVLGGRRLALLVPAAAALSLAVLLFRLAPRPPAEAGPPKELLENLEFYRQLELLENWETLEGPRGRRG